MEFNYEETFNRILKESKNKLAEYDRVLIVSSDLEGSSFDPQFYSDDIYLFRQSTDGLVYIHDDADDTDGEVQVNDLRIILESATKRKTDQAQQAIEIERYLFE